MDVETQALVAQHRRDYPGEHTNLQPAMCACRAVVVARAPNITGDISPCCGAMAQRNGSCTICTSCGSTAACG